MFEQFGLGRYISPVDKRDYKLANYIPAELEDINIGGEWPYNHIPLNQGETPHCGGFGIANYGINTPVEDDFNDADGHHFYDLCKIIDGEPGEQNGTSIRSVAKVMRQIGMINSYAFAHSIEEILYWLIYKGPMVVGTAWTYDMFMPDSNNIVHPTGTIEGGHCYVINKKTVGSPKNSLLRIQNSWNGFWGNESGQAYISVPDFVSLFNDGGEVIAAIEIAPSSIIQPTQKGCSAFIANLINKIMAGA